MERLKELSLYVLGALIAIGFFALMYLLVYKSIPETNSDILNLVVGSLIGSFATVVGYFFGSSKGSSDKNKLLQRDRPEKAGCTDPKAKNFDPEATIDNGTCIYEATP